MRASVHEPTGKMETRNRSVREALLPHHNIQLYCLYISCSGSPHPLKTKSSKSSIECSGKCRLHPFFGLFAGFVMKEGIRVTMSSPEPDAGTLLTALRVCNQRWLVQGGGGGGGRCVRLVSSQARRLLGGART